MTTITRAQPPPRSLEAERTTLGALLIDPDKMIDVAPELTSEDFFDPVHRAVYRAMERLYDERSPIDFVTVAEALKGEAQVQRIGGPAFLAELAGSVPTSSHIKKYAEIVREKSLRRQLATYGAAMTRLAGTDDRTTAELLETAEQSLLKLSQRSSDSKPVQLFDMATERYEHYTTIYEAEDPSAHYGITTGFPALDHLLTGLTPGHLMVLAGRPSMGKTALALDIAHKVAKEQEKSVTILSLEMTKEQLFDRTFAGILGIEAWKLKKGSLSQEEFQGMGPAFDSLKGTRIFVDDDTDRTLTNLRSKARRQQMQEGLDLLIVDYLTLIEVTDRQAGDNMVQRITYISKSLKNLARELQCPIIALSQLSRACEQRSPPIPVLSDLRESGAIEQDADSVLMLYRSGYYFEDCENPDLTDVYVGKNRHGATGHAELRFNKEKMTFESIAA